MRISDWSSDVCSSDLGALDFRDKRVNLEVKADYTLADRSAGVTLGFDNIEPADFADVVPELAPLKYLRTPLGGSLILHLNENGEQVDLGFDLKRSEEHTSELQSLMRTSYDVFCLKKT